jgi:predicted ArsR family transcriptional regulator
VENTEEWGPAPTRHGAADALTLLSPQRRRVFEVLTSEPLGISAVAAALGLHTNTAREHLDGLVSAGLALRSRLTPTGRGRPGWGYAARPGVASAASGEYATLARVLADHVARQGGDVAGDMARLGEGWGKALIEERMPVSDPDVAVIDLLGELGFDPETTPDVVRLRQCPMLAVARERPDVVCEVHRGLVIGAMETAGAPSDGVRLEAFAERGACLLHLR